MDIKDIRRKLNEYITSYRLAKEIYKEEKKTICEAEQNVIDSEAARKVVQQVAEIVQINAHKQIASVVSRCLSTVFGEDAYEFKINFSQKRGRTEAELIFVRENQEIEPIEAAGGGAIDVAAFGLRLACLMLVKPKRRKLLILDEPFRFVSKEYRPKIKLMLESLAKELGVQIVMVTHIQDLIMGKIIEL